MISTSFIRANFYRSFLPNFWDRLIKRGAMYATMPYEIKFSVPESKPIYWSFGFLRDAFLIATDCKNKGSNRFMTKSRWSFIKTYGVQLANDTLERNLWVT